jgi:tellurite resistance protein
MTFPISEPPPKAFTRVPPAIFPSLLGLLGLGLAWRRASEAFLRSSAISDFILGATLIVLVAALTAYGLKFLKRPSVLIDDLRVLPGRSGLAAGSLSLALTAATLLDYNAGLANVVFFTACVSHVCLAITLAYVFATGASEQRQVTPVWHLSFVGFILLPLSAIPLGYLGFAQVVFMASFFAALFIYGVSLGQMFHRDPPPLLRPLLAIHLAPLSLFGTIALMLGLPQISLAFATLATLLVTVLVLKAKYLITAGFSPLWGAFTFPLAAYTSLMLMLGGQGLGPLDGDVARIVGLGLLLLASALILFIAYHVFQMWMRGTLAQKTNAATA